MQSTTYKDIIDDKIAEWHDKIGKLEEQADKASSDNKSKLLAKVTEYKSVIDEATIKLQRLDEKETVSNTLETKDKILEIFGSIDKDFTGHESKTPFML